MYALAAGTLQRGWSTPNLEYVLIVLTVAGAVLQDLAYMRTTTLDTAWLKRQSSRTGYARLHIDVYPDILVSLVHLTTQMYWIVVVTSTPKPDRVQFALY